MAMENTGKKINWIGEFGINESLHDPANSIAAIYGRLRYNNRTHPDYDFWKSKMIEWGTYEYNILQLHFDTKEEADPEVKRLNEVWREVNQLEKKSKTRKRTVDTPLPLSTKKIPQTKNLKFMGPTVKRSPSQLVGIFL